MIVRESIDFRRGQHPDQIGINEELVHKFHGRWQKPGQEIEIYKNPTSLKIMGKWNRAISDAKGNIWVSDSPQTTHSEILVNLYNIDQIEHKWYHPENGDEDLLLMAGWQRYSDSNNFYVAESFSQWDIKELGGQFDKFADAAKEKNPQYNFIGNIIITAVYE